MGTDCPIFAHTPYLCSDLNYRISIKSPRALPLHLIAHKVFCFSILFQNNLNQPKSHQISTDLPCLLLHDQLTQERSARRTLHNLQEGTIRFKPTYKYIVGSVGEFKSFKKRIPGWCDRVLYATWADQSGQFVCYLSFICGICIGIFCIDAEDTSLL